MQTNSGIDKTVDQIRKALSKLSESKEKGSLTFPIEISASSGSRLLWKLSVTDLQEGEGAAEVTISDGSGKAEPWIEVINVHDRDKWQKLDSR